MVWAMPELRHVEADLDHGLLEELAVLALVDGLGVGADHLDAVLLEHAGLEERHRGVQRRLAAEGRQQRVGLLADDDFLHHLRRDRLDVGAVRELRIGHDRGRIRVHQDDLVAFFLQRLAGLDAGIVEFAALADDDGAGADDEDFPDRGVFGHGQGRFGKRPSARLNFEVCGRVPEPCKGRVAAKIEQPSWYVQPRTPGHFRTRSTLPRNTADFRDPDALGPVTVSFRPSSCLEPPDASPCRRVLARGGSRPPCAPPFRGTRGRGIHKPSVCRKETPPAAAW